MIRFGLAAGLAALALALAQPGLARPFTAKDLAMMDRVSAPRISADGRYVAYALRSTDWDGNKGTNALHVIDLQGDIAKPVVLLTGEAAPPGADWSPDGRWLYYLSSKAGSSQVWRASPDGAVRQQMTAFPLDIGSFVLGPDGHTMVVAADVYPDCTTLACTKDRDDANAKSKSSGILIKSGQPRRWDSYEDEKRRAVYRLDLSQPGAPTAGVQIARGFDADVPSDATLTISPDGRTAYFGSIDPAAEIGGPAAFGRIYKVPLDGSGPASIFLAGAKAAFDAPALSPDGKRLAYLESTGELSILAYARTAIKVMDLASGKSREVAPALDATLGGLAWSTDGRSLLAAIDRSANVTLSRIDVATGDVTPVSGEGTVSGFDSARNGIVFVRESLTSPGQLYVSAAAGAPRQLTSFNSAVLAQAPLSQSERFSFAGWNGETVYGYVTRPEGYVEGRKYPVAFLIHGGPHGSFGNAWSYRWNPQVWAGMGYAVVAIDFHGSSGYGEKFGQSIVGHWGDRPLEDLQKGWAYTLSRYPYLDGNRACALGGSYGGYMVAWIAGNWQDPWKCLVNHAGIYDVRSMAVSMDSSNFIATQFGSAADISEWEKANPAAFSRNWKVPMLVIHGGRDYRVPTEQGIAAHNVARARGVPTELLVFPDENHWVLKPQNSVQWYRIVEDWLDRWTGSAPQAAVAATK